MVCCQVIDLLCRDAQMIQPFHADFLARTFPHRLLDKVSRLVAEEAVNPAYKLILWLRAELRLSVESPAQEPVGIFDCDDAASYDLSAEWVAFTDVFDVRHNSLIEGRHRC